jgi:hypothetical protein
MRQQSTRFNERALLSKSNVAQPVSSVQVEVLYRRLAQLKPTLEPTPFGTRKTVGSAANREITARIEEIQKRLMDRRSLAKHAFRRASR